MPRRRPRTAPVDTDDIDTELEFEGDEVDSLPDEPLVEAEVPALVEPEPTKETQQVRKQVQEQPKYQYPDGVSDDVKQAIDIAISCQEAIPSGLILGPSEDVRFEGDADDLEVVIARDVYRVVYPGGSRRPSFVLLYPRGARILKSTLTKM